MRVINQLFVIAMISLSVLPSLALATVKITNPEVFIRDQYANRLYKLCNEDIISDKTTSPDIYTNRLRDLINLDRKEAKGEEGRLDFDFWTNGNDCKLSAVKITSTYVDSSNSLRRIVIAKFKNMNTEEELHFYFEKINNNWQLDDVRSVKNNKWTLSILLKYGEAE